ncbi:MAG: hypothetical protein WCJ61_07225 [Paludibacter sp.]
MKTSNYIIVSFLLMLSFGLSAQKKDSIVNRNVTVEREYKPIIQDAGKINSMPKVLEPKVDKTPAKYSDFNLPLTADFNIHTLPAAELEREKHKESKGGYGRVGLGNYFNTLADFAYPIIKMPDLRMDVSLNHFATFGDKAHSTTKAALAFDKYFDNFDLYAGVSGGHEYLKYYGDNYNNQNKTIDLNSLDQTAIYQAKNIVGINSKAMSLKNLTKDSTSETFWRFNANLGIRSLPLSTDLRYLAELQYNVFDEHNGLTENVIHSKAGFNALSKENRLGVDVDLYNMIYQTDKPVIINSPNAYSVLALNPYYSIENPDFDIRIGVKSSFSFGQGKSFNPSLDVRTEWKTIPKYLSMYAGITGGYQVNTMNASYAENRYLSPGIRIDDTYTPYELFVGIKVKPIYNLLLDAFIDYKRIDNQYFFINREYNPQNKTADSTIFTNRFDAIYSGASHLKIGMRANYNLRNRVNVELKGAYNSWTVDNTQFAWNKPKWEASLNTDVHITRELSVSFNTFLEGARYAKLGNSAIRMRPKIDINLGTSYAYNNWLTFFGKVNNLINNPYQEYYGYQVQGINALFGASFSF